VGSSRGQVKAHTLALLSKHNKKETNNARLVKTAITISLTNSNLSRHNIAEELLFYYVK
jgi:hypothetical protein